MTFETIPAHRASELLGSDVQLVDVREHHEVATGMLPGARHIPLGDLELHLHTLSPHRPVAVICESGARSRTAAELLVQRGYDRVINLDGGMSAARQRSA
jgi:rhodanese-related sulfurtransferase